MSTPQVEPSATGSGEHADAVREVMSALVGARSCVRETHQLVDDERTGTALLTLALLERTGPARVSELAERARLDASVVSRQTTHLEQAGLVERRRDPEDGRACQVTVTDEGTRVLEEGRARMAAVVAERLHGWDPGELCAFAATLRRLTADLSARAPA